MLIQCSSISEVHGNIDTSPCRSKIQLQPKGNQGMAALVGLAHASRAGPSHPPRSWVGQDGSPEDSRKHQERLQRTCMFIRLPSSSWSLRSTYHYHLVFFWRGSPACSSSLHARFFPTTPEAFVMTMMILPGPGKRWRLTEDLRWTMICMIVGGVQEIYTARFFFKGDCDYPH